MVQCGDVERGSVSIELFCRVRPWERPAVPKKVRELEAELRAAGFEELHGRCKGSHRLWIHRQSGIRATISGKAGADATPGLEGHVRAVIRRVLAESIHLNGESHR